MEEMFYLFTATSYNIENSSQTWTLTTNTAATVTIQKQAAISPLTSNVIQSVMKWVFICVGILGVASNLVVMVIVTRARKLRQQPRNWFVFHQSLADFASAIFITAFALRTPPSSYSVSIK
jgi:hypothetical protein